MKLIYERNDTRIGKLFHSSWQPSYLFILFSTLLAASVAVSAVTFQCLLGVDVSDSKFVFFHSQILTQIYFIYLFMFAISSLLNSGEHHLIYYLLTFICYGNF